MTAETRFMLYVDSKPRSVHRTLEEAQERGLECVENQSALQIVGDLDAPRSRTWNYDYKNDAWVEKA